MATHSSILACRIPGMGEPGGLPSMGLHRVGYDWSDLAAAAARMKDSVQFSSVQSLSRVWLFETHGLQHARPPYPSTTPGAYSNSCPYSWWCYPTISFSVVPLSSCLQSFPASGSFPMSQVFTSGSQSIGVQLQHQSFQWIVRADFPLGWTGWISLLSKGLSKVFSNTTVQKHQFLGAQLSL